MSNESTLKIVKLPGLIQGDTWPAFQFDMTYQADDSAVIVESARVKWIDENQNMAFMHETGTNLTITDGRVVLERELDTSGWPVGRLVGDFEITFPDQAVKTILRIVQDVEASST